MFAKSKLAWAVVLVTALSLWGVADVQARPGNAPPAVAGNETGPVPINPGQEHWYTFYSGPADPQAGNKDITVMLAPEIADSLAFDVWTPAGLQRAAEGKTDINARPVGSGTLHPIKDGDRYGGKPEWTGGSGRPQTYVVQVKSKAWGPVRYNLSVNGNFVQFPDGTLAEQAARQGAPKAGASGPQQARPTAQATPAASGAGAQAATQPAASATPAATSPAGPPAGSGPGSALPLDGVTRDIKPGQSHWYVLDYPGESKLGDIPNGTLLITAVPWGSANFSIWSNDRLRKLELGDIRGGVPVGTGMLHPVTREGVTRDQYDGKPAWSNRSRYPARFLVEVHTTGDKPSSYTLEYVQK